MHEQVHENPHIGSDSYLASDYLNHFTEIVILLEEVLDHPAYMADIREWKPVSYCEHFRASSLPFSDLAIWAYEHAPVETLKSFETLVEHAVEMIFLCREELIDALRTRHPDTLRDELGEQTNDIRQTLDDAGKLIDRNEDHVSQSDIDALFA